MIKLVPNYTTGRPFRDRVSGAQALESFYHALLSKKTTFKKQHANKTSMSSREHLPCCCGFWGRWLASMKRLLIRVPAKLPHIIPPNNTALFLAKEMQRCALFMRLKAPANQHFERLCVKHFLFILNSNPTLKLKGSGLPEFKFCTLLAYSAIQNLYDFS